MSFTISFNFKEHLSEEVIDRCKDILLDDYNLRNFFKAKWEKKGVFTLKKVYTLTHYDNEVEFIESLCFEFEEKHEFRDTIGNHLLINLYKTKNIIKKLLESQERVLLARENMKEYMWVSLMFERNPDYLEWRILKRRKKYRDNILKLLNKSLEKK